jgi:hypothetical protein
MNSFVIYFVGLLACVAAQSNYDTQANSVEYAGEGLPESTILDGRGGELDEIAPIIFRNRTKAALNCAAGFMQVRTKTINYHQCGLMIVADVYYVQSAYSIFAVSWVQLLINWKFESNNVVCDRSAISSSSGHNSYCT